MSQLHTHIQKYKYIYIYIYIVYACTLALKCVPGGYFGAHVSDLWVLRALWVTLKKPKAGGARRHDIIRDYHGQSYPVP